MLTSRPRSSARRHQPLGRVQEELQPLRNRQARQTVLALHHSGAQTTPRPSSPVIVVGMHRSGTSLTAQLLTALGVDMGPDATLTLHESRSFVLRNGLLLDVTKADWDQPQPFLEVRDDAEWNTTLSLLAERTIDAPRRWLLGSHEPPHASSRPWGWKDPRSSLTWPIWSTLYPNARFVRVRRNRDAVVTSLVTRSVDQLRRRRDLSLGTLTVDGAEQLADTYADALAPLDHAVGVDHLFDIDYDELVASPTDVTASLADWLGADRARVQRAAAIVRGPGS